MICLILGTSEGKNILSLLNKYTDDIFVTTATEYGGELLKDFNYKYLNTKPLNKIELKDKLMALGINILVDATHPYAKEITKNAEEVCKDLNIEYIRYERPSIAKKFNGFNNVISVKDFDELKERLDTIEGNILNTTGSRSVGKFLDMSLRNRIIHRVLPTTDSVVYCLTMGVKVEDLIAIKGPISKELNRAFIKEYEAKAIVMKDSGMQGGTEEKIEAAIEEGIFVFILDRDKKIYKICFDNEEKLVNYIKGQLL